MSRYRKFTTICCAAVFALGLAACGGGGDDGLNTSQEQMLQERVATLQDQIAALAESLGVEPNEVGDEIADLQAEVERLQGLVNAAEEEAEKMATTQMVATAAKLYAGISAPSGANTDTDTGTRAAQYDGNDIDVRIVFDADGDGTADSPIDATLSEDKKTTVAANHGWAGKRYADPAGGDMVEAVVYSNVEPPKQGRKFGSAAAVTTTGAFEYQLASGALALTSGTNDGERVSFTGVTRTAGTERFRLPDPNPTGADIILIPGSYHGVSGTYNCTPADAAAGCSAAVAAKGFTVSSGDTWTFTPSDANARVMSAADVNYASYGWWIRKSADDRTYTASAFVDERGTVAPASGLDALNGTATYMGGAAGKYALSSSTGGTNDAGHFTARATLEANFTPNDGTDTTTNGITGMIDMFIGADGERRNWEVKLNGSPITDVGVIGDATDGTVWTIDGTAAKASGNWTGTLRDNGSDGVPQVATGTFYTEYGLAGKMVGAFGANKQ